MRYNGLKKAPKIPTQSPLSCGKSLCRGAQVKDPEMETSSWVI